MEQSFQFVDIDSIISKFPEKADSLFVDCYLSDLPDCSTRVFRLYDDLPLHYHKSCDEILFLLKGSAEFFIEDENRKVSDSRLMKPGMMVTFYKNTVHRVKVNGEAIFLSCDTPRRAPDDAHFIDESETKGIKFVTHIEK